MARQSPYRRSLRLRPRIQPRHSLLLILALRGVTSHWPETGPVRLRLAHIEALARLAVIARALRVINFGPGIDPDDRLGTASGLGSHLGRVRALDGRLGLRLFCLGFCSWGLLGCGLQDNRGSNQRGRKHDTQGGGNSGHRQSPCWTLCRMRVARNTSCELITLRQGVPGH
jgi:hypothetical protein